MDKTDSVLSTFPLRDRRCLNVCSLRWMSQTQDSVWHWAALPSTAGRVPHAPSGMCLTHTPQLPEALPQPQQQAPGELARSHGGSTLAGNIFPHVSSSPLHLSSSSSLLYAFIKVWRGKISTTYCYFYSPWRTPVLHLLVSRSRHLQERTVMESGRGLEPTLIIRCIHRLCTGKKKLQVKNYHKVKWKAKNL